MSLKASLPLVYFPFWILTTSLLLKCLQIALTIFNVWDWSVNKAVKEFLRKFQQWYSSEVESLCSKNEEFTPVDLHMSKLKPVGADWLMQAHHYLQNNPSLAKNGFRAAGITSALKL